MFCEGSSQASSKLFLLLFPLSFPLHDDPLEITFLKTVMETLTSTDFNKVL